MLIFAPVKQIKKRKDEENIVDYSHYDGVMFSSECPA